MPYPLRDRCASGHRLAGANVAIRANGARRCLACARRHARDAMARRRNRVQPGGLHATVEALCGFCGRTFKPNRLNPDGRFCSEVCRDAKRARQQPGRFALVTWKTRGDFTSAFQFFDSYAEAAAAAPPGVPFTIADRTIKAARERPSIEDVLHGLGRIAR